VKFGVKLRKNIDMTDKRFLKVKKLGEERYFRTAGELQKFFEKQEGTWYLDTPRPAWWYLSHNIAMYDTDTFIAGKFIFQTVRGYFSRTSGDYTINIISVGKADLLSLTDIKKLFKINN
jgi:hypothetical protein